MKHLLLLVFILCSQVYTTSAQNDEDLLSLLDNDDEERTEYTSASFKTSRIINAHSLENTAGGVLDFKISHRFGFLNGGAYELFGLDQATIRLGLDYGISDRLMIGVGRSTVEKSYDGFVKYKILRQSTGKVKMPLTAIYFGSMAINTLRWQFPDRTNYFTSRLSYTHQLLIGSKLSDNFSLQLMPTIVHRNLVETKAEKNDVFAMGIAARQKLTKRTSLNVEYFYVLPNQIAERYRNAVSIGFDIETGGHVFQLHFTNATSMIEKGFITETTGNWLKGDIRFGFNISRVFTIVDKR